MAGVYNNEGLTSEQIEYLDGLTSYYEMLAELEGSDVHDDINRLNRSVWAHFEARGVDLKNPIIHFAVTAGAAAVYGYVNQAHDADPSVNAMGSLILGAIVNVRPRAT